MRICQLVSPALVVIVAMSLAVHAQPQAAHSDARKTDVAEPNTPGAPAVGSGAALGYYRQPAIHGDTIVFVAEGDLWKISTAGGVARRLTSHPGTEGTPAISPDGRTVAFTAQYEGPTEVYTMPIDGGVPVRRTYGASRASVVGWKRAVGQGAADASAARLLYATTSYSTLPNMQLVALDVSRDDRAGGGELVPLAQAADGDYADDGTLFFTRLPFQGSHTKRYKGGTAQNIWRFAAGDGEATPLTADYAGTSKRPLCWGGRVYFVTDREGTMNLWSMSRDGGDLRQHTRHAGWEVASPALDGGRIVYQLGADLRLYDIAKDQDRALAIRLDSDFDQMREQWLKKPMDYLTSAHLSPSGDRVVLTARGQVFVAPHRQGRLAEVTRKPGVRYRQARFLPDGKALIALSDESGEVELWQLSASGVGDPNQLTTDAEVLRWEAIPSPDGRYLAHHDKNLRLFVFDTQTRQSKLVDESRTESFADLSWSPDSRWLAYTVQADNMFRVVRIYGVEDRQVHAATTDRYDSFSPAWSPDGKWLYLMSDRNLVSAVESPWGSYQPEPFLDKKTKIYHLALTPNLRSPWAPQDELHADEDEKAAKKKAEEGEDAKEKREEQKEPNEPNEPGDPNAPPPRDPNTPDEPNTPNDPNEPNSVIPSLARNLPPNADNPALVARSLVADAPRDDDAQPTTTPATQPATQATQPDSQKSDQPEKPAKPTPPEVKIDFDGLPARLIETPLPPGNYTALALNDKALFWLSESASDSKFSLVGAAVARDNVEVKTLATDVKRGYDISQDGKKLLFRKGDALYIVDANPAPTDLDKKEVNLAAWRLSVRPREEWRQMFTEAWRLERDYFYDLGMHGVDWKAMLEKYLPLVDRVTTRGELSDLLAQMVSELSALHIFVSGGDMRASPDDVPPSSLGALLERDEAAGGYRVAHIYESDPDEPDRAGPLVRPGVEMNAGDVIRLVNGAAVLDVPDIGVLLRHKAGQQVLLRVQPAAGGDPRDVIVTPLSLGAADDLRYHEWEFTRRKLVDEWSGGQIGYVHLRAMGARNFTEWAKGYYPVFTRAGLIVDVRHNNGGNIDSWILGRLLRKAWFYWSQRVGQPPSWNMQYAFRGHVAALCNERTASDGEAFAEGVRRLKIGKVFGTRTWGGEIWLSSSNVLVDRGIATAAEFGVFGPEGAWLIEGHGVEPDVVVDNLPHATFKGEDAQLRAAVDYLLQQIKEKPVEPVVVPLHPKKAFPYKE